MTMKKSEEEGRLKEVGRKGSGKVLVSVRRIEKP